MQSAFSGRFGATQSLQESLFLVAFAGEAGKSHQKKKFLGGRASPNPTTA